MMNIWDLIQLGSGSQVRPQLEPCLWDEEAISGWLTQQAVKLMLEEDA